jgi:hypothetical protein
MDDVADNVLLVLLRDDSGLQGITNIYCVIMTLPRLILIEMHVFIYIR